MRTARLRRETCVPLSAAPPHNFVAACPPTCGGTRPMQTAFNAYPSHDVNALGDRRRTAAIKCWAAAMPDSARPTAPTAGRRVPALATMLPAATSHRAGDSGEPPNPRRQPAGLRSCGTPDLDRVARSRLLGGGTPAALGGLKVQSVRGVCCLARALDRCELRSIGRDGRPNTDARGPVRCEMAPPQADKVPGRQSSLRDSIVALRGRPHPSPEVLGSSGLVADPKSRDSVWLWEDNEVACDSEVTYCARFVERACGLDPNCARPPSRSCPSRWRGQGGRGRAPCLGASG